MVIAMVATTMATINRQTGRIQFLNSLTAFQGIEFNSLIPYFLAVFCLVQNFKNRAPSIRMLENNRIEGTPFLENLET